MNGLISDVFGDEAIFMSCSSGECIHYSQVPGYQTPIAPQKPIKWVVVSAAAAIFLVFLSSACSTCSVGTTRMTKCDLETCACRKRRRT